MEIPICGDAALWPPSIRMAEAEFARLLRDLGHRGSAIGAGYIHSNVLLDIAMESASQHA